jgi:hypothetical protein
MILIVQTLTICVNMQNISQVMCTYHLSRLYGHVNESMASRSGPNGPIGFSGRRSIVGRGPEVKISFELDLEGSLHGAAPPVLRKLRYQIGIK